MELHDPDHAEPYRNRAGIEFVDARTVTSKAGDWWTAWKQVYL